MAKEDTFGGGDQRDKGDRKLGAGEFGNVFVIGVGGAIATAILVSRWWISFNWVYSQWSRSRGSRKSAFNDPFRTSFQEEARKRYNRRMQEEYEQEMERVEQIRRMQSVFNRERNKHKRNYESWAQNGDGTYHQNFQRNDWYWKGDTSFRDRRTNFKDATRPSRHHLLSLRYSVLGLDRTRTKPYTDEEIKLLGQRHWNSIPIRTRIIKAAEAKFREVMTAYEAIKVERKKR